MDQSTRATIAAVVVGALLTACSASAPSTGAGTGTGGATTLPSLATTAAATAPVDDTSTSTAPAATDTEPPVPPSTAPNLCAPVEPVPGEALEFSSLTADLDGDSAPDQLLGYGLPTADGLLRWRARLELADGPTSEIELVEAYAPVTLLGTVQTDARAGDGTGGADEVLVTVGASASGMNLSVLGADEHRCLFQFEEGHGAPAVFSVAATVTHADGIRCEGSAGAQYLVLLSAESSDGLTYTTRDTKLQRVTTNLIPETITEGTASADGPGLFAYGIVDCPGIIVR